MQARGGAIFARLRCRACGQQSFALENLPVGRCARCGDTLDLMEMMADRRVGPERRGPDRLQRIWDIDPRSWVDRRHR